MECHIEMHGRKSFSGTVVTKYTTRIKGLKRAIKICLLVLIQHKTKKYEQNERQQSLSKIMFEITFQGVMLSSYHWRMRNLIFSKIPGIFRIFPAASMKLETNSSALSSIFCSAKNTKHVFSSCSYPSSFPIFYVTTEP